MTYLSETVRLTVPIPADLSRHITLCAFAADLSRGQLVRRWLALAVADAEQRHADLLGKTVPEWLEGISLELAETRESIERQGQEYNPISHLERIKG